MKRVKFSYRQFAEICNYKKDHKSERLTRNFWLSKKSDVIFYIEEEVRLSIFILLFIPDIIITFFYCVWDGGLREFELPSRHIKGSTIYSGCKGFDICQKIWDKTN